MGIPKGKFWCALNSWSCRRGSEELGRCCRDSQGSTHRAAAPKTPLGADSCAKASMSLHRSYCPNPLSAFGALIFCWDGFFWYLEGFSSFKWEPGSCPLLLPPVILELGIADNDFLVVFVEAGVEVEGNVIPSLEIQCKPAKTRMELLLLPQKPWTLLQGFPKTAERKPHRPLWATTGHLHIYLVQYLMLHEAGVIQGWRANSSPPAPPSSAPWKPPTLGAGHPQYLFGLGFTVPVMVMSSRGTSPACRGSSKGTFWETTGIWCQQKMAQWVAQCHPQGQPALLWPSKISHCRHRNPHNDGAITIAGVGPP